METVVVNNGKLEEFRERLERWDELCTELRTLYYKYLDLAAFRSEKCYFPGRRCKRSWKRQYDVGDLTLMWTYIANTAPLCGKLIRALAEVGYKIHLKALESFKNYGGVEKRSNPTGKHDIVNIQLNVPVHGYLVLWNDKLYVIWGEFDNLPKESKRRSAAAERMALSTIRRYEQGASLNVEVEEYEIDREYERLLLEVPLPEDASKLLGGWSKAPVALFRNLGWLLSDDSRRDFVHRSNNLGQVAMRIFDWIALAMYSKKFMPAVPLVFKLSVYQIAVSNKGLNASIDVRTIGRATKIIKSIYKAVGIKLSTNGDTIKRGYEIIRVLQKEAFKLEDNTYVVDHAGAWIAYSAIVTAMVMGDGSVEPLKLMIATKASYLKELAEAVGGLAAGHQVHLMNRHMRLTIPAPATPPFEKSIKLYHALVHYPVAAVVKIGDKEHVLTRQGYNQFSIGRKEGAELYEVLKRYGIKANLKKHYIILVYSRLKKLANYVPVRFLNDLEKEMIRETKPVVTPDIEKLRDLLYRLMEMAKIVVGKRKKGEYIRIIPNDPSKLYEISELLNSAGIRHSVSKVKMLILIQGKRPLEAIRMVMPQLFSKLDLRLSRNYTHIISAFPPPLYISFV